MQARVIHIHRQEGESVCVAARLLQMLSLHSRCILQVLLATASMHVQSCDSIVVVDVSAVSADRCAAHIPSLTLARHQLDRLTEWHCLIASDTALLLS